MVWGNIRKNCNISLMSSWAETSKIQKWSKNTKNELWPRMDTILSIEESHSMFLIDRSMLFPMSVFSCLCDAKQVIEWPNSMGRSKNRCSVFMPIKIQEFDRKQDMAVLKCNKVWWKIDFDPKINMCNREKKFSGRQKFLTKILKISTLFNLIIIWQKA